MLRYKDGGAEVRHPGSLYALGDGRYLFPHLNHNGHFGPWGHPDGSRPP